MKMTETVYQDLLADMRSYVTQALKTRNLDRLSSQITTGDMWKLWGRVEQERSYHPASGLREKLAEITGIPLVIPYRDNYRHGEALEGLNDSHAVTAFKRMIPVLQSVRLES